MAKDCRLSKFVVVQLVTEGAGADAQELCRALAIMIAAGQGVQNGRPFHFLQYGFQRDTSWSWQRPYLVGEVFRMDRGSFDRDGHLSVIFFHDGKTNWRRLISAGILNGEQTPTEPIPRIQFRDAADYSIIPLDGVKVFRTDVRPVQNDVRNLP
jgi:hypothetical protein